MSETATTDPSASRGLLRNLLLLAAALGVCLLLAEVALRIALPAPNSGWSGVPSLEERVAAVTPKQPGEYRVLALGDSFTEYRDTASEPGNWARVVESLATADGKGLRLYNFSQMGTGLPHYLKNLEDFGTRVQPDLVLLGLYLGNDVLDYELASEKEARGLPVPSPKTLGRRPSGAGAWLKENSAFAGLLARAWSSVRPGLTTFDHNLAHAGEIYGISAADLEQKRAAHDPAVVDMARREQVNPWDLAFGLVTPSRYADLLAVKGSSRVPAALERLAADVARVESVCQRLQATCAWVVLPVALQVDARYHEYFRKVGFETAGWMTEPVPLTSQLLPAMKAKGAFVVDALPPLKAAADRELFLPNDTHLNAEGQRLVGEAAYTALKDAGAFEGQLRRDLQRQLGAEGAGAPADPRLDALLKGAALDGTALEGASEEERRLALKIAALHRLRQEMQAVLTSLPEQKADAEKMQAEVIALEKGLDPAAVKRVLKEAEERYRQQGAGDGTLLARARGIDEELGRLLEKEPPAASDAETVKSLKAELAKQQHATAALGSGAAVAFRALRMLEQMKLALPELRKLKAAKR